MKLKKIVLLVSLVLVVFAGAGRKQGIAADKPAGSVRIAVIDVGYVLDGNKKATEWKEKMQAKQQVIIGELEKLSKEIEAISADMDTRKVGSSDYMKLMREGMEKTAMLKANEEYYQKEFSAEKQKWTDLMYQEILNAVNKLAKERGIDLVLRKTEYPAPSVVLYNSDQLDITKDVIKIVNQ